MRLQLIITRQPTPRDINHSLFSLLQERLAEKGGLLLTEEAPDVAHVFGAWTDKTADTVANLHKRGIPIIYTSLEGLQAAVETAHKRANINTTKCRNRILKAVNILNVCGAKEQEIYSKMRRSISTRLVYNPFFTSLTTDKKVLAEMLRLYQDTIETAEQNVRKTIATTVEQAESGDKNINNICCQILYIKHVMLRGGITQEQLDSLSNAMTTLQYDEEVMLATARQLKIHTFAAALFFVLAKKAALTEGFMPFPMKDNKASDLIGNNILTT